MQAVGTLVEPAAVHDLEVPFRPGFDVTAVHAEVGEPGNRSRSAADRSGTWITRISPRPPCCWQTRRARAMAASRWGQSGVMSTSTSGRRAPVSWPSLAAAMSGLGDATAGGHMVGVVVQQPI